MSSASLNLITGINGSGKTLWLLQHVEKQRKAEGRPVYYFAIPGIKEQGVLTEWKEIQAYDRKDPGLDRLKDPDALWQLPQGAIIVIDEAQKTFPVRKNGSTVPAAVERFAEARHEGFTFYLVTQDAKDIDLFVRRRVGKHVHLLRAFGLQRATVMEWEQTANPQAKEDLARALKTEFSFPKDVYGWYKSSDNHQIKKTIPWKKLSILIWAPIAIIAIGFFVMHRLHNAIPQNEEKNQKDDVIKKVSQQQHQDPKMQATEWAARFKERIEGVPMSPQFYDAVYEHPATFPKIAGCMEIKSETMYRCTCNTQQGTRLTTVNEQQCRYYMANGWFDPTKKDGGETERVPAQPSMNIATAPTVSP